EHGARLALVDVDCRRYTRCGDRLCRRRVQVIRCGVPLYERRSRCIDWTFASKKRGPQSLCRMLHRYALLGFRLRWLRIARQVGLDFFRPMAGQGSDICRIRGCYWRALLGRSLVWVLGYPLLRSAFIALTTGRMVIRRLL